MGLKIYFACSIHHRSKFSKTQLQVVGYIISIDADYSYVYMDRDSLYKGTGNTVLIVMIIKN